jgi:hypothetical protein
MSLISRHLNLPSVPLGGGNLMYSGYQSQCKTYNRGLIYFKPEKGCGNLLILFRAAALLLRMHLLYRPMHRTGEIAIDRAEPGNHKGASDASE